MFHRTHGMTNTRVYRVWASIITRCHNPNSDHYKYYGGKGIVVCDRWRYSFKNFLQDMGIPKDGESIDRIYVHGDYSPENCRWATDKQQRRNRTDNRKFYLDGEVLCLVDICAKYNISRGTLSGRLRSGMSLKEAVTKPVRSMKKNKTLPTRPK